MRDGWAGAPVQRVQPADGGVPARDPIPHPHPVPGSDLAAVPPDEAVTTPVVVAEGSGKVFASGDGVRGVDLEIDAGTVIGFIGPSGSGKTTTMRLFTGVLVPSEGSVRVFGERPTEFDTAQRSRLGYMPQRSVLYSGLRVEENLDFFASIYGLPWRRDRLLDRVLDFVELSEHRDKRVDQLSGGMQRRLSLAAALVHEPELLFLDEPTAGIDPVLRRKFWDHFQALADEGRTLIVTTQYVGEAAYCDRVAVLSDGELVLVDTPDGLRRAAFGGDVIHVDVAGAVDDDLAGRIAASVDALSYERRGPAGLQIVVDEAATALPRLLSWSSDASIEISSAEEYLPPYDDVFVEIVEQHRNGQGASHA